MFLHLLRMAALLGLIGLAMVYPFLPGQYDRLAMPLSTMAQAAGVVGLLLVPIGLLWLAYELWKQAQLRRGRRVAARSYGFGLAALIALALPALTVSLVAYATAGIALALISFVLWLLVFARLRFALKQLRATDRTGFVAVPLYLILIPVSTVLLQLGLAAPLTSFSRSHAIANSREFVEQIETYATTYNRYPLSLLAIWQDYYPDLVGIDRFHYTPGDNSYNLLFEQPRFLFDNIGTREWVVYNPRDQHRIFSHTSWFLLLTPEELERSQGWYAVHLTPYPHWRYFWFD